MPSITAKRKCPDLIFVKPRFDAYKAISLQIREIFAAYTPIIELLSLDEAYLDVTENLKGISSATQIAEEIPARISRRNRAHGFGQRLLYQVSWVNDDGRTVAAMEVLGAGIGKIDFTRELPPCTSRAPPGLSWGRSLGISRTSPSRSSCEPVHTDLPTKNAAFDFHGVPGSTLA